MNPLDLRGLGVAAWQRESLDLEPALERLRQRISKLEPRIHALVTEEDRIRRLRSDIESCRPGPLARVPIGIKDIFHVDGMETRAGSSLPSGELSGEEADSVRALKRAGGVILGKRQMYIGCHCYMRQIVRNAYLLEAFVLSFQNILEQSINRLFALCQGHFQSSIVGFLFLLCPSKDNQYLHLLRIAQQNSLLQASSIHL